MKINRLFEIVYILLDRERITAKELAERFEVSMRTSHYDWAMKKLKAHKKNCKNLQHQKKYKTETRINSFFKENGTQNYNVVNKSYNNSLNDRQTSSKGAYK